MLVAEGKTLDIARPTVIQQKKKKSIMKVYIPVHERQYKGANVQVCLVISRTCLPRVNIWT